MSLDNVLNYFNTNTQPSTTKPLKPILKAHKPKPIYKDSVTLKQEEIIDFNKNINRSRVENIKKSEKLRAKITKDINNNENIEEILKDSIKCIGLMTGDIAFTKQNINNLNKLIG